MDYRRPLPLEHVWDLADVGHANSMAKQVEKDINAYTNDTRKEQRLNLQECRICMYYRGKIGGSAITYSTCLMCGKDVYNASTCIDKLCMDCAKTHKLCAHCGDDINNKPRRKL